MKFGSPYPSPAPLQRPWYCSKRWFVGVHESRLRNKLSWAPSLNGALFCHCECNTRRTEEALFSLHQCCHRVQAPNAARPGWGAEAITTGLTVVALPAKLRRANAKIWVMTSLTVAPTDPSNLTYPLIAIRPKQTNEGHSNGRVFRYRWHSRRGRPISAR